jgi:hypothetical protein
VKNTTQQMQKIFEHVKIRLSRPIRRIQRRPRILGSAQGEFAVLDDFNNPLPKGIEDVFRK